MSTPEAAIFTEFSGPTPPPEGTKIVKLDLEVPGHQEIFDRVFEAEDGLYKRQFPDEGERVPSEELREGLQEGETQVLVMTAPDREGNERPVAMAQGEVYDGRDEQHATGLIGYITKDPEAERADGVKYKAYHLRDALTQQLADDLADDGKTLESMYWEANHPDYYFTEHDPEEKKHEANPDGGKKTEDSFDGATRRQIITGQRENNHGETWCFRPVGGDVLPDGSIGPEENRETFTYWMAPNNAEVQPDPTNSLGLFHAEVHRDENGKVHLAEGGIKTPEQVEDTRTMLQGYYEVCEVADHPRLAEMEQQLDAMKARIVERGQGASQEIAGIDAGEAVAAHGKGIDSAAGRMGVDNVPPPSSRPMPGLGEEGRGR